ncbi:TraR/DksA family transcriptional regulator [Streptomyces filamentosus]|uniref:TraR/DksA family transcriptional regulator n=1 Tax=Streptomyces filamentosus TaxID=67294 RepID=UPI00123ADA13|nr:TraR/DksA C4-type zinc finger protein [Streptomyces filamentosus]KAA6217173.1 DNA-binding protein [Streptomyces filamentosus]
MVAKKTAAKKSPAAAGATGSAGPSGVSGESAPAAPAPASDDAPKKTAAKKTAAKKTAAKKTVAKKTAAKKTAARKTAAEKAPAGKTAAKRTPAGKAASGKHEEKTEEKAAAGKAAAKKQTGARTVAAKKTAGGVTTAEDEAAVPSARAGGLAVRPGEDPWTPDEVAEARSVLQAEVLRLRSELVHSQEELTGLMRDSGDGAGDDQADTGTKNITREHELALAANAREMLEQTEHALERLDAGTYGLCEVCGRPIGKARMQAFPRATLCVEDKQKQERRG